MKIAFDLDGTLWSYQTTFKLMQRLFLTSGHEVGILTTHLEEAQHRDRVLLKERGFGVFDFFIARSAKSVEEGEPTAAWKLRMVAEHDIDLLFDDCEDADDGVYQEFMDSGMVVYVEPRRPLSQHYQ